MKSRNIIVLLLVVTVVSLLLNSCTKDTMNRLEGTWKQADLAPYSNDTNSSYGYDSIFRIYFSGDSAYTYSKTSYYIPDDYLGQIKVYDYKVGSGNYVAVSKAGKSYLVFANFSSIDASLVFNGKWQIVKLNKDALILVSTEIGGRTTKEFIRDNSGEFENLIRNRGVNSQNQDTTTLK